MTQKCKVVKCQEGYSLEGEKCVKKKTPIGSCFGRIPEGGIENPNASAPTRIGTHRVLVEVGSKWPCSYLCADGYIIGKDQSGKNACLKCQAGTWNPTKRTCIAEPVCPKGTVYGKGHSGEGCYTEGNCLN